MMKLKVIKVESRDKELMRLITADFSCSNDEKYLANHLEAVLIDDRTFMFTAIQEGEFIGYTLAYRFPSLFGSRYLAYLHDSLKHIANLNSRK